MSDLRRHTLHGLSSEGTSRDFRLQIDIRCKSVPAPFFALPPEVALRDLCRQALSPGSGTPGQTEEGRRLALGVCVESKRKRFNVHSLSHDRWLAVLFRAVEPRKRSKFRVSTFRFGVCVNSHARKRSACILGTYRHSIHLESKKVKATMSL